MRYAAVLIFLAFFSVCIYGQTNNKKVSFGKFLSRAGVSDSAVHAITNDPRFGIDSSILGILKRRTKPDYSFLFTEESVARGRSFLKSYIPVQDASKKFGIPADIIVAVFRVESDFGLFLGTHTAPNTYFTLFSVAKSEKRKRYLASEFKKICIVCEARMLDPFSIPTSWAGAVGLPQFMPSSFSFAIDGDGDGNADILRSFTDAVWSIAHYLHATGWNQRDPIASLMKYNNSRTYAKNVLKYAKEISKK